MLTVKRQNASVSSSDKQALSVQEIKSMTSGKSTTTIRSRTKLSSSGDKSSEIDEQKEIKPEQNDVHPAERVFSPIVTCRYPETDWQDAEPFPSFLPMVSRLPKKKKNSTKISAQDTYILTTKVSIVSISSSVSQLSFHSGCQMKSHQQPTILLC